MGQLFKKYADPFTLLTGYIQTSRMCEFISVFLEQKAEDDRWEYFLHKVYGQSYTEFCETLRTSQEVQDMSDEEIETTVKKSMDILGNFRPNQDEGEK